MEDNKQTEGLIRLLLVGPDQAGKSCIFSRYCDNIFFESTLPTIGVDFKVKTLNVNGN